MLVPTIILCLVSSTFACETYTNASAYFKNSDTNLKNALSWETPKEPQANYVILLQAVVNISYALADGVTYDDAYTQFSDLVARGEESPTVARDQILSVTAAAEKDTLSIRNLVDKTCGSDVTADCDCKVEEAIKDDAKLQAQAALLIVAYESGFGPYQADWTAAAENNTISEYLAASRDKLEAPLEKKSNQFKQMEEIEKNGYSG